MKTFVARHLFWPSPDAGLYDYSLETSIVWLVDRDSSDSPPFVRETMDEFAPRSKGKWRRPERLIGYANVERTPAGENRSPGYFARRFWYLGDGDLEFYGPRGDCPIEAVSPLAVLVGMPTPPYFGRVLLRDGWTEKECGEPLCTICRDAREPGSPSSASPPAGSATSS